jgi:outer membrane receptor protein involved in Fe transport
LPSREGDIQVFGQPPGNRVNEDKWTVTNAGVGLFLTPNIRLGNRFRVEPGVRFEPSIINGNRVLPVRPSEPEVGYTELQFSANPRLRVSFQATSTVQLFSAAGGYQQPAAATDLSPVFGSPVLEQGRSWQVLVGTQVVPNSWFRGDLVVYAAKQDQLTSRSPLATPPIAGLLNSDGQGRSMGAQVSLHASLPGRATASLSYAASRAERRRDATSLWRPFDSDQPHQLRVASQWSTDFGLQLGGRLELSSGMPRTPVIGAIFNTSSQRHDPIFGQHNSERLPSFVSLSLRAGYERKEDWGLYRVWLDVVNATNRENVEEVFYSSDFSDRGFIQGLPILPVLGAELWL